MGLSAHWKLLWSQDPCFISSFRMRFPHWYFPPASPVVPKPVWLKDPKNPLPYSEDCKVQPPLQLHSKPISGGILSGGRLSSRVETILSTFHPLWSNILLQKTLPKVRNGFPWGKAACYLQASNDFWVMGERIVWHMGSHMPLFNILWAQLWQVLFVSFLGCLPKILFWLPLSRKA